MKRFVGTIGVILLIWWGVTFITDASNDRLPTTSPGAQTIGGYAYLVGYYGVIPALAGALIYYSRRRSGQSRP